MKNILFALAAIVLSLAVHGQTECKVLIQSLSGSYTGKCKDGLAQGKGKAQGTDIYEGAFAKGVPHGRGTYTWSNGDRYEGDWEKGIRQGEGTFYFKDGGKDTLISGLWEADRYKGPKPPPPKIHTNVGVERFNIEKTVGIKKRVLVNIYQNGVRNRGIEQFMIDANSGSPTTLGESVGFENINFPIRIKVSYSTWNKLRTAMYDVRFEFEIFEEGDWVVDIHN
jgi:hypothetical protein